MRFFRDAQSGLLKKTQTISWRKWIEERLNCLRVRRQSQKNRRELLKLGQHLLKDLGFNSKGYPIKPNC